MISTTNYRYVSIRQTLRILFGLVLCCAMGVNSLGAQSARFNNWYFGNQAAISFASGSPVAMTNSAMSTTEGCASISDASGNLMFYTNGINVYNSAHAVMSNGAGLTGHQSSTQSAIIVQRPGSNTIYYIFSADADVGPNGIRYSEVDMSLAGGLGAVTANKNIPLQTPSCEKITAVRHCNNRDIWIVTHDWNSNGFRTWLITSAGINMTPVLSNAGSVISGINQSAYGQLKSNPDGNKLLAGYYGFGGTNGTNKFELYDFNNSTGVVSNGFTLAVETGAYGCEFSPNGRIAYGATNQGRLVQFDLCAGSNAAVAASKFVVGVLGPFIGSLQLGPDGKVYVSRNTTSLSVISNPNVLGAGCNFVNGAISLSGRTSSMGLPNMAALYIRPEILPFTYTANCTNVSFTPPSVNVSTSSCANAANAIQSVQWNFGDPSTGASNTSTVLNATHNFSSTGTFNVQLILNLGCYSDTLNQVVTVSGFSASTSSTPATCAATNGTATVTPAVPGTYTYLWSNGANTATATGLAAGTYTVTVSSASGCSANATAIVSSGGSTSLTVTTLNASCSGSATGSATASGSGGTAPYTYSWSNGASGATASGLAAGNYSVTVTDAGGCTASQTFVITQPTALTATVTAAAATCAGVTGSASASVSGGTLPYSYLWSNGSTGPSASGLSNGTHTVTITDAAGCTVTRTVLITQPNALTGSVAVTQVTCNGAANGAATASVTGGTAPYTYSWSNAASAAGINGLSPGAYSVNVTDAAGCSILLSATITQPAALNSVVSVNPASCSAATGSATISSSGGLAPYSYAWSNGSSSSAATGLTNGTYTVVTTDASGCTSTSSFTINQAAALSVSLSSTMITCFGAANGSLSATVTGGTAPYTYAWTNGGSTSSLLNLNNGSYTLTVTDAAGCTSSQSAVITQPAGMNVTVTAIPATCGGADGSATASVTGGVAPLTYAWNTLPVQTTATATTLSPGTYTVTITDGNGCQATQNAIIPNTGGLSLAINASAMVSCFGGNDGVAIAIANGGTAPYSYSWSNGEATSNVSGLIAGTYTCTATDANGCTAGQSVIITQPTQVVPVVSTVAVTCFSSANGSASISTSGGLSPYTYSWSTGAQTASLSNLAAGTYTVTILDQNNCSIQQSVVITSPAALQAVPAVTALSCAGSNDGAVVLALSGGIAPYAVSWTDGGTGASRTGLSAGSYSYTITDAASCQTTGNVIVNAPVQLQAAYAVTNASCYGTSDASIQLQISGGTNPFQVNWTNGQTGDTISGLAAGSYSATISDANGCQVVINANVSSPDSLSMTYVATASNCSGSSGSLLFTAYGGQAPYQFSLDNGAFQASPYFGSLTAGVHILEIQDANQCTITRNAIVGAPVTVGIQLSNQTDVSCNGFSDASAQAIVSGGTAPFTITWSSGESGTQANQLSAGPNQVTVTDAAGCSAFLAFDVNEPAAVQLSYLTTPVTCYSGTDGSASITITGGSGGYSILWETGATTTTLSNVGVGYYDVTVTDASGCLASDTIFITQPAQPILIQANVVPGDCGIGSGTISLITTGGTAPYDFSWNTSPVQTTSVASNLSPGTYTVTVTDANGCVQTASATLIGYAPVTATLDSVQDVTCFGGNDGHVFITLSGGVAPFTYQYGIGPQPSLPQSLGAGSYNMTIIDANGCAGQVGFVINQPPALQASSVAQHVTCFGYSDGRVLLNVNGGVQPYQYAWSNGVVTSANNAIPAGNYTCTITDAHGCTVSTSAQVQEPAQLIASLDANSPGCSGINNGSIASIVSGGTGYYTYQWSTGQQAPAIDGLAPGDYTVNIIDENACLVQLSASLQAAEAFTIYLSTSDTLICNGEQAIIEASASGIHNLYSYVWDHGVTGAIFGANPQVTTTYTVLVQDSAGCIRQDSITIQVNQIPQVSIFADDSSGCMPFCAKLHATSSTATSFYWTIADSMTYSGPNPVPCFTEPGLYPVTVRVKDDANCSSEKIWTELIRVYPAPNAAFTPVPNETTLDQPLVNFVNQSEGANAYNYYFGDPYNSSVFVENTAFTFRDTGTFEVSLQVGNEYGCTDETVQTIHIGGFKAFYVPKAFTPNADGLNDVFLPKSSGFASEGFEMRIFDRWGHEVFFSDSWEKGWDGTVDGRPVPVDLYVCKIRYYDKLGNGNDHIGAVTVTE